jgi:ribosomal protein S18
LNNQDLKSIINTACKYNDIEVLEKIASSKLIKTAGVRDLLQGLGLQMSQTANQSQFKDKNALTNFIASSSTVNDREAASEIYEWWANKIKELGSSTVNLDIAVFGSTTATEREISFTPKNCVEKSDLEQLWNSLPSTDLHKMYGLDPTTYGSSLGLYDDKENPPTMFNTTKIDSNGNEIWPANLGGGPRPIVGSSPGVSLNTLFLNIVKGGSANMGYLDYLRYYLNSINQPKMSDNIHVKIFDMLNTSMSNKAMSSMIRKNALAETPRAGLISNWKYIVSLPKEIESRMAKTPKNIMDYKQKLALKKYGRDLSQILNRRIQFQEYVYNPLAPPSTIPAHTVLQGLDREIPFHKVNELSNNYFMDPLVMAQVQPLMARTGELLNKIIPELDKDTSLARKVLKTVVTPSEYLNSRGKEFH